MDGWLVCLVDGWFDGWMVGLMDGWLIRLVDGWSNGWMVDMRMDG